MKTLATGRIGRVIYAHLEPEEDLYEAILATAERENIRTGLVLDITGGLSKVRLSMPIESGPVDSAPGIIELEGLTEAMGSGVIGQTIDSWSSDKSGIANVAGQPYAHVHMSVTTAGQTHTGHLIHGCHIRSVHPISHFTMVLAEVEGVNLEFRVTEETTDNYPQGIPIHHLEQLEALRAAEDR